MVEKNQLKQTPIALRVLTIISVAVILYSITGHGYNPIILTLACGVVLYVILQAITGIKISSWINAGVPVVKMILTPLLILMGVIILFYILAGK